MYAYVTIFAVNALLSALSIANLGIISSMVGWLLDQKHHVHSYQVNFAGRGPVALHVLPEHLWIDQGHTSNGIAGYGFFLGLFGMFVAWQLRRRRRTRTPSRTLTALLVLQTLAVLFTLSALIFVFLVTNQTRHQSIDAAVVQPDVPYPQHHWTPETWFQAVHALPLADDGVRRDIARHVRNMQAWKWMLVLIFIVDVAALVDEALEWFTQRRRAQVPIRDYEGK